MKKALEVYYNLRVYQHWLQENNLTDDWDTITVDELSTFIKHSIPKEDYDRLLIFCKEAY